MRLTITEEALAKLMESDEANHILYLYYDTDGCCGVNGIPSIKRVSAVPQGSERVENNQLDVFINKEQMIFFHPHLHLSVNGGLFRLSSDEQMLNPSLRIT